MKKNFIIIVGILLIIIILSCGMLSINAKKLTAVKKANKEYEQYANKEIYGTEVATILNKASNNNEQNNVQKDDNNQYIEDDENSIIVELVMITNEEKEKTTTYRMETIQKVGIKEFINNFNTAQFDITKIEYHQNGKIKYIEITQQYE